MMKNIRHSPLFEPVIWEEDSFRILDELGVPDRVEYIAVREVSQAVEAVRDMRTRAFGQVLTFLYSGALLARRFRASDPVALRRVLEEMTERFCAARPTFDFRGLGRFFHDRLNSMPHGVDPAEWLSAEARGRACEIVRARERRAERAARLLPQSARVLTHCNVSGELVAMAHFCRELGKELSVIATETRPYLQGVRLTAWELAQADVPVALIPDCAVAQVMERGAVNVVLVGADRCAQNGDIINKVGTYPIALLANDFAIPFYVLAQPPRSLARGADVTIEERPADELLRFRERFLLEPAEERLAIRYPAFDMTPAPLITTLIEFDGLYTPATFAQRFAGAAPPVAAAEQSPPTGNYVLVWGVPDDAGYRYLAEAIEELPGGRVLVPEMRPALRGVGVARELLRRHIPATLTADGMTGTLFAHAEIHKVCVFHVAETTQARRGDCGALTQLRLARAHRVPVVLRGTVPQTVGEAAEDSDVGTFLGCRIVPAGVSVFPLDSEVIPTKWLDHREAFA